MRNVTVSAFVSLDGVMQAPGGPEEDTSGGFKFGGWEAAYPDDVIGETVTDLFAQPFDLLLGRKTYDIFAAYWPHHEHGDYGYIGKKFNSAKKHVATSSKAPLAWNNSVAIHDAAADVARLKREDGPDLLIQGSSVLIHALLAHGLLDHIQLLVYPVVLGRGKRFFSEESKPGALKLESSRVTPSGVTINRYAPAGPVKTGSYP